MFRSYTEKICRTDVKHKEAPTAENYTCDICQENDWLSETDVEIHRKDEHFKHIIAQMTGKIDRFCTICMKLQDSQADLLSHIKMRHLFSSPQAKRIEREIFICDHCDHIFFNKDMLQAHILYTHTWPVHERNTKMFECPKCKKTCKVKSIWFHMQMHEIPSISACDICLTNFFNSKELLKHLESHPMYYKCEICGYQMAKDIHFEKHIQQHHNLSVPSKPYNSRMIQGAFRRHTMNVTHLHLRYNIHHALRGLDLPKFMDVCILCREICTDKNEVRNHILRDHCMLPDTRKLLRCLCGEEFFNQILLKHHIFKMKGKHRQISDQERPMILDDAIEADVAQLKQNLEKEAEQRRREENKDVEDNCNTSDNEEITYVYAEICDDELVIVK